MKKTHELKSIIIDNEKLNYFYTKEKRDANGNARYRVYIIDPDGAVYERIFKCYENQLPEAIKHFIKPEANNV